MRENYRHLIVWQKAVQLSVAVYTLTEDFPGEEKYSLTSQIRRCAVSIPSNIAEGRMRSSTIEFRRFLLIAFGSGAELETQIEIAKQLKRTKELDYTLVESLLSEVMKMLRKLIININNPKVSS